jgi:hypothetical protein
MFHVRLRENINTAGWYVAHIFKAKDRNVDYCQWGHGELVRRTALSILPCNYFYVPKREGRRYGEDPTIIAFFYEKFASLYRSVWEDFLHLVSGSPIPAPAGAGNYRYSFSHAQAILADRWRIDFINSTRGARRWHD